MRVSLSLRRFSASLVLGACVPALAAATDVSVLILDRDGNPVGDVAISIQSLDSSKEPEPAPPSQARRTASINQRDLAFEPHLLIVEQGTEVSFLNDDDERHHVYSFSQAKQFDMTVDSGSTSAASVVFDTVGVVTLGCNIHDDMLAYIQVVDTPYFGKTTVAGNANFDLAPGHYELSLWTPRMPGRATPETIDLHVMPGETLDLSHQIMTKLYPPHEQNESSLRWRGY